MVAIAHTAIPIPIAVAVAVTITVAIGGTAGVCVGIGVGTALDALVRTEAAGLGTPTKVREERRRHGERMVEGRSGWHVSRDRPTVYCI